MKKLSAGLMLVISIAAGSAVQAQDSDHEFSANVTLATEYMFRGITQTDENPAVQGGFDYAHVPSGFYAGVWASNVSFAESTEFDLYGGFAGEINGIAWDIGGIFYKYPGSSTVLEEDFVEVYGSLGHDFESFDVSVGLAYSPDYFAESGDSLYVSGDVGIPLPQGFVLAGHVGHQSIDNNANFGTPDYMDWSIGVSREFDMFTLDLSYIDTDLNDAECFGDDALCSAVVFSISASF